MKNSKKPTFKLNNLVLLLIVLSSFISSCIPTTESNGKTRSSSSQNSSVVVNVNHGKVLKDNPIILSGKSSLSLATDLNKFTSAVFITTNPMLQGQGNCLGLVYCFEVRDNVNSTSPLIAADNKWGFRAKSLEFLQVNTYYHLNIGFSAFLSNLDATYLSSFTPSGSFLTETSIPSSLKQGVYYNLRKSILTAYSNCDEADNANYSAATNSLCFGYTGQNKDLKWADDSTIIYHELGHFLQDVSLNLRNPANNIKASMGDLLYSEAGAIGEGLADYYSYFINGRTHWGEWAAGFSGASRPLNEDDVLHVPALKDDNESRLKYPDYLTYDPNAPTIPNETVHNAGMIVSHYLVALTKDLELKCSMTNKTAREAVLLLVNESLAELGDLTTVGTQNSVATTTGKINLSPAYSNLWLSQNNPVNYRSFSQMMAKKLLKKFGPQSLNGCGLYQYTTDDIEVLLDSYGLLLFKTYNENRNFTSAAKINTPINIANRVKTTMPSKASLILDPTPNAATAFVIDNRAQILKGITDLQASGSIKELSAQTPSDLSFNNGLGSISRGEVVAVALNLYNDSGSTIGGVQVLANDWDHADDDSNNNKPCSITSSYTGAAWPTSNEGGSTTAPCQTVEAVSEENFAPVCFMQIRENDATKWVSQKVYMEHIGQDSQLCLDKTNSKSCFIRAIKGADKAYYSKIDPKKTWGQTMANPETGAAYSLDWSNVILFEVSKHITPGTSINCRLRARFTNCADCYHDAEGLGAPGSDDYKDKDFNGSRPFSIIHLNMTILD